MLHPTPFSVSLCLFSNTKKVIALIPFVFPIVQFKKETRLTIQWCRCKGCCSSNILHTEHIVLAATLRASDWQQSGGIIPHAVNHSLVLLRMGKELPETCWANLKINKLSLLHLVGHLLYSFVIQCLSTTNKMHLLLE